MESSQAPAVPAPRRLREALLQHPLLAYIVMAYAFSWITMVPYILWEWGKLPGGAGPWSLVFVVKAFVGPFLAALIMTRLSDGKEGQRRFFRRLVQWRADWPWYAFILLAIPAFFLLGVALMPGALASFTGLTPTFLVGYPINFIIIALAGGPLAEEPGWRGFALPRLLAHYSQDHYAALKASLVLGLVWTFWHLPDFLTSAQHGGPAAGLRPFYANLPIFLLMVMALTIVFTWVYNHAHGSVFMAILLHASVNTLSVALPLFPIPAVQDSELSMLIGWGALALLILVLTRGKLGYQAALG
jgi:uncharacterized protein